MSSIYTITVEELKDIVNNWIDKSSNENKEIEIRYLKDLIKIIEMEYNRRNINPCINCSKDNITCGDCKVYIEYRDMNGMSIDSAYSLSSYLSKAGVEIIAKFKK